MTYRLQGYTRVHTIPTCSTSARSLLFALLLAGLALLASGSEASAQADAAEVGDVTLSAEAADLSLHHGKKRTTGASVEKRLSVAVRVALNEWAEAASDLELSVVVPKVADALVLGAASQKQLGKVAAVLDETWELLDELAPVDEERQSVATVVFLFDEDQFGGETWVGVLEELVARNELVESAVRHLRSDPSPLMLRQLPGFLQPSFDIAGDASKGDDEFRLENEVAHKLAQCVLRTRFGEVPESIRWGIGFLVEQRQFRSIYQMNATGFVAAKDHFDWPKRTREVVLERSKKKGWSLADEVVRRNAAGRAEPSQMMTWAALDYLYKNDSESLRALLGDLAALHDEAAGWRTRQQEFLGDGEKTTELLNEKLDAIDTRKLASHLKRLK